MTQANRTSPGIRIAFFGDSLVNGTGDDDMLGWVGRACAAAASRGHDVTCYNLGIRRDRSIDVAARWRGEAKRRLPAGHDGRVVFSFGTNDAMLMPGIAPHHETLAAVRSILRRRSEQPMLFVGPPPMDDPRVNRRIAAIDLALGRLCCVAGVGFLSVFKPLLQDHHWQDALSRGDGSHPDSGGYRRLSGLIDAWPDWRSWLP